MTQSVQETRELSRLAFEGFIPRGHVVVLSAGSSDKMGYVPKNNQEFQDRCRGGCRTWRLFTVTDDRMDVPQGPPSLDRPPFKNGELIIVCKCGDSSLRQDRYASIRSDGTHLVVSIPSSSVCVHWMTQLVQDAISLSIHAFEGLIPPENTGVLVVEISDKTRDHGRQPKGDAEFDKLCRRGCCVWRLLTQWDIVP